MLRGELWQSTRDYIRDTCLYEESVRALIDMRGYFTLAYRCNPFKGFVVSPNWDLPWREHLADEAETAEWVGTGTAYRFHNETRPGSTLVRAYAANASTSSMLARADCFFDWQRPLPEDFAAYDWRGRVLCYTVAHEEEVYIRKDLSLAWLARMNV